MYNKRNEYQEIEYYFTSSKVKDLCWLVTYYGHHNESIKDYSYAYCNEIILQSDVTESELCDKLNNTIDSIKLNVVIKNAEFMYNRREELLQIERNEFQQRELEEIDSLLNVYDKKYDVKRVDGIFSRVPK